ncbi:hypothetical protein PF011_g25089 [Phytophthora fragariae]|uniref:Uncharacterized protein n=1 Tax=Phytophthora fragariae TaxID=53985 RepID=A0A6A3I1E9_9STRA|nr:hypothetical protein PF003_g40165 [Phytophthora fragariae]KAE8973858.1 hypothetical protein PF011_g25089 [Phytophthora fragariae]KAE9309465.1 hypothetical protein PF008_g20699 [Phytophthora fragariae]
MLKSSSASCWFCGGWRSRFVAAFTASLRCFTRTVHSEYLLRLIVVEKSDGCSPLNGG